LGVLLCALVALFGVQRESANRDGSGTNQTVFKRTDIQGVVPRLDEGKIALRKAPELAQDHLFCPGDESFTAHGRNGFSRVLGNELGSRADHRIDGIRGRGPPMVATPA
jgi:hypothetical protein